MSVFEQHQLGNGLRVLSADMPQVPSVTCMIMLAAGSRYETPDTNGIAHFAEHMFFKGTERRPTARDISKEIDAIGGEFNAFTGKEYTGYYVKCAAESRDIALDVVVDMLRNSKFDGDEVGRGERGNLGDVAGAEPHAERGGRAAAQVNVNGDARVRVRTRASGLVQCCVGVQSYPRGRRGGRALGLLATILGGGMSAR